MKAIFRSAAPYAEDALNLPVDSVDAALPYYEKTFGFRVIARQDLPHRKAILERDDVKIGLAENGGDPSQEGCLFEVENLEAAFEEIKGKPAAELQYEESELRGHTYRVFFEVAPDGLCYMIAERKN
ncbi:MAG TPA: VOC family protein [Pyrinomonadaceae bacterium]|nr:VOC family protein [Pyrinomonadaceae bacterium]